MEIVKSFKEEFLDLEMGTSTVKSLKEEIMDFANGFETAVITSKTCELVLIILSLVLHLFFIHVFLALQARVPAFSNFIDAQWLLDEAFNVYYAFAPLIFAHYYYIKKYRGELVPVVFTISSSFAVGLICALMNGKWARESAIMTAAAIMIVRYKNRRDSSVRTRIIFGGTVVLFVFLLVQIIIPLEKLKRMIYDSSH